MVMFLQKWIKHWSIMVTFMVILSDLLMVSKNCGLLWFMVL